jgi:hypothetical protein
MHRLCILALLAGSAGAASAQTVGPDLASFNLLANTALTLTGFSPAQPLLVSIVGTSPGTALTLTNAVVGTYHDNDNTSINGQAQGQILNNSLTAPVGATFIPLGGSLPGVLNPGPGITVYQAAAGVTNNTTVTTITGSATSIVIIQVPTAMSLTDADIILAGGILAGNVYWQIGTGVTVINNDAVNRTFPGTVVLSGAAANIAITCSGAGSLAIGRQVSLQGGVTVTQSGAGMMTVTYPSGGTGGPPGANGPNLCAVGGDRLFPSPARGPTAQIGYCMDNPGSVVIRVYNAIGDIVAKINDDKASGAQTSTLNTGRLAPGVYFYVLEKIYGGGLTTRGGYTKFAVIH